MSNKVNNGIDLLPQSLQPKATPEPPLVTEAAMQLITQALVAEVVKAITPIKSKADEAYNLAVNALPKSGGLIDGNLNINGTLKATGNIGGNEPNANVSPSSKERKAMSNEEILLEINKLKSEIAFLETMLK